MEDVGLEFGLPYDFEYRSYQLEVMAAREKGIRRFATCWHRRAGKDKFWLNFMIEEAWLRPGLYAYFLDTYKHAKEIVWHGLDREGKPFLFRHIPPEIIARRNEVSLRVEFTNGSAIQLFGSDHIDQVVGINPMGLVFSEYSVQNPNGWLRMQPILAENEGWAAFNFTPRGQNHAKELWDRAKSQPQIWFTSLKTVEDTYRDAPGELKFGEHVTPESEVQQAIDEGMDPDIAREEFYVSFNGVRAGAYYKHQMEQMQVEDRYTDIPWDPSTPVFTVWDLGVADATAILFCQWHGEMLHVFDYLETTGIGLGENIGTVRSYRYTYSNHYAPHDIKQRELVSGRSRLEAAQDLGISFRIIPNLPLQDGIDSTRRMLPLLRIDRTKCKLFYDRLGQYRKEYDEKTNSFADKPVHDASSHAADAARYLSIVFEDERPERFKEVTVSGLNTSPFDDDEAWN